MVGRRIGRFTVLSKLGEGGMATVWKARDELLGRSVALKILNQQLATSDKARRRFLHDAQTAAALNHPGIVTVYDSGEDGGRVYIALSLIEGETLSESVARRLLPIPEAIRIALEAGEALAHAHAHGVIHRDVTGRNLMIRNDGRVVVLDFGLAVAAWESRVTSTEAAPGTALYLAPELISGHEANARSDVYGLGVVLYEALTGAFPHSGNHAETVFFAALHQDPVPPRRRRPEIPARLEAMVLESIARDPAERIPDATTFVARLHELDLGGDDSRAERAAPVEPPARSTTEAVVGHGHRPIPDARKTIPDPLYLAVLPFTVPEGGADSEGVARGLADRLAVTLEAGLAQAAGVRVVSGAIAGADPRDLAEQLGANALLGGSIAVSTPRLRVTWSVRDPWRRTVIAGGIVDGTTVKPLDLEDRTLESVLCGLHLTLEAVEGPGTSRPPDPAAAERYRVALAYLKRWDNEASLDGAIRLLKELVEADPKDAKSLATWSRVLVYKSWLTHERSLQVEAASLCARAVELEADSPDTWLALGEVHLSNGRADEARTAFEKTLVLRPGDLEAQLGLAVALRSVRLLEYAEQCLRESLASHPEDWRVHHAVAMHAFETGRFADAARSWRKVLELVPDNPGARRNLGSALYRMDRLEDAAEAYRASIAMHPTPMAFSNLGTALFYLGRFDEAATAQRKAVELNPLDARNWGNLGNTLQWAPGNEAEMRQTLDYAIAIARDHLDQDPADALMWAYLAGWLADRSRETEALAATERALDLAPESAPCLVRAGHVFFQLGDPEKALDMLEKAVQLGYGIRELERSREFAPLTNHPRFRKLVKRGAAA